MNDVPSGSLARADGFAYRTTVGQVMTAPLVVTGPDVSLADAAARMSATDISSIIVADPEPRGIVTERDVLRRVGSQGAGALALPVRQVMSSPLVTVRSDALVATALGRMHRLSIRHLLVVDETGRAVGIVAARALLQLRSRDSLLIGDAIVAAADTVQLAAARARVPALAAALRRDGAPALEVAAAISATVREATARAAGMAEEAMRQGSAGPAPAAWCLLVLGSAGRGESLLFPDQDNALIHDGQDADDGWFAEFGGRVADILDAVGIPYCNGGVMAREAGWRHGPRGWRDKVGEWISTKDGEAVLSTDIFFDFRAVAGDGSLARDLRRDAVAAAARAPLFLRMLARQTEDMRPPLGLFGRIRSSAGAVDLKKGGTMPIVAAARTLALAVGSEAVSTPDRLASAVAAGRLVEEDRAALEAAFETIMGLQLDGQLAAIEEGRPPGSSIVLNRLDRRARRSLGHALRSLGSIPSMVADGLSA